MKLDSVAYHVDHLDAAVAWVVKLGAKPGVELGEHGRSVRLGGLCVDLFTTFEAGEHGDIYFAVDDLDAYHAACVGAGIEVTMAPHETGTGARLMELAGPGGLRWTCSATRADGSV